MSVPSKAVMRILRLAFQRKQAAQPGFSLRALARDMGVSPAFASNMLNGKRVPPKRRLEKLCYILELDVLEKEQVIKSLLLTGFANKVLTRSERKDLAGRHTSEVPNKNVLSSWMNLAVLEGLTLKSPHNDPETLRERLGLTSAEFKKVITALLNEGLVQETKGRFRKKSRHLYLAGGRSRQEVRAFHEKMILKARQELVSKTSHDEYQRRLINGFTLALNPEHLERIKGKIIRFLDEISKEASEGDCVEVYQCNLQLFPLTKKLT